MWTKGKINGYEYEVKHFDEGSEFGINGCRNEKPVEASQQLCDTASFFKKRNQHIRIHNDGIHLHFQSALSTLENDAPSTNERIFAAS